MTAWSVVRARHGDAEEIARLLATVVPPHLLDLTIWGSPLFYRYCQDSLQSVERATPRFYVLSSDGAIGGVISLRHIDGQILLDTTYVIPALRAQYLSMLLIHEAVTQECLRAPASLVAWDVFSGRPRLEAWHRTLGGREESCKGWWLRRPGLPNSGNATGVSFAGLAEADEQHARWGFSSFEARTSSGTYRIGRLPGRAFRITDARAAADQCLLASLSELDAEGRVLLMGPVEPPDSTWSELVSLKRYVAPFETFTAALGEYL
jgi:hypothetical protein